MGSSKKIQRRVTGHDERELHLLNGALGKRRARGALGNAEPSEHVPGQGGVEVLVEVGEEGDHLAHAHGTGEVGPLGQVGDERLRFRAHLIARHANVARRRMGHAGDHLQQRGLARAVRAEQPYDAAGGQADSKAVERHRGAIALSEVAALEQGRRRDFGDKGIHGKPPHRSESLAPSWHGRQRQPHRMSDSLPPHGRMDLPTAWAHGRISLQRVSEGIDNAPLVFGRVVRVRAQKTSCSKSAIQAQNRHQNGEIALSFARLSLTTRNSCQKEGALCSKSENPGSAPSRPR